MRRLYADVASIMALSFACCGPSKAATLDEIADRLSALEKSNKQLQMENQALRRQVNGIAATKEKRIVTREGSAGRRDAAAAPNAAGAGNKGPESNGPVIAGFLEKLPGDDIKFKTPNGEIGFYGAVDLSADLTTKGLQGKLDGNGAPPVGNMGWMPAISTNQTYVGVRGYQNLGAFPGRFIYQFETAVAVSATPGVGENNSAESNQVTGALASRNSFIGLRSDSYGSFFIGKTDAPYKTSTAIMHPSYGMIGDYSSIMGNTGGDNRAEFMGRLDHSIWYVSPVIQGLQFSALFSPGQNRSVISDNLAAGETDCTGGDIPGSGGNPLNSCSDGGFSDAFSTSLSYRNGPLYLTAAYELHTRVNRSSDLLGLYANVPAGYLNADVANEDAAKIGAQYALPTGTTISAIGESMHRYIPSYLEFQNERQRFGTWLAVEQTITENDSLAFGWAHAFKTPGDPGQHNDAYAATPGGQPGDTFGGVGVDNAANLYSLALKHKFGFGLTGYIDVAGTINDPYAHYNLGGNSHGVSTDCHDASDATGGTLSNPHCWAGGAIIGVSTGMRYQF